MNPFLSIVQFLVTPKTDVKTTKWTCVKLEYPLIVFGVSDINRKFYPIAFMFTRSLMKIICEFSNSSTIDYIDGLCKKNNPIESYNIYKAIFTNRLKLNLIPAFKMFQELVNYESSQR